MSPLLARDSLASTAIAITGASGGIGGSIAQQLTACGAEVILHHHNGSTRVTELAGQLSGGLAHPLAADLSDPQCARDFWTAALLTSVKPLTGLVLNAGVNPASAFDANDEDWDSAWDRAFGVNVIGAAALLRAAAQTFAKMGGGEIVLMSSWAAEQGTRVTAGSAYAASKAAIRNLGQSMARHFGPYGVRVYVLAPGVVDAGMGLLSRDTTATEELTAMTPTRQMVTASEIATLIAVLLSGSLPSLSGATVDLNGAAYIR